MTEPTPDTTELLEKAVTGARRLEIKRILEKLRNQEPLKSVEMKTLEEYQREEEERRLQDASAPSEFKNARNVAAFLREAGWKVNQSTLYAHVKEGKLKPDDGGRFGLKSVHRYAAAFLNKKDTLQKLDDEQLNRRKLKCEIERIQEQTRRERLRRMIEEGRYIQRDQFELELAARTAVLDTMRRNTILSDASEVVALVSGDPNKIPDLIQFLLGRHEDQMNQYATTKEFHVLFEEIAEVRQDQQD